MAVDGGVVTLDIPAHVSMTSGAERYLTSQHYPWISPREVLWIVRKVSAGKARGLDGFSMAELRSFGMDECSQLAELFNLILRTGRWSSSLRHASPSQRRVLDRSRVARIVQTLRQDHDAEDFSGHSPVPASRPLRKRAGKSNTMDAAWRFSAYLKSP